MLFFLYFASCSYTIKVRSCGRGGGLPIFEVGFDSHLVTWQNICAMEQEIGMIGSSLFTSYSTQIVPISQDVKVGGRMAGNSAANQLLPLPCMDLPHPGAWEDGVC